MLKLNVIGCSDAFNSGGHRHTSFLVESDNFKILLDCGANTVLGFKKMNRSFSDLDCVVLTHFHGDHYGGLPYLILEAAKVHKRSKPLLLISPPGLEERLNRLFKLLYPGSEDALQAFPITYISFNSNKSIQLPFGNLLACEVLHAKETLPHGVRLELDGKIISYSGDTTWHDNLIKLADNSDLFICECNFFDTETPSHLNYVTLREKQQLLKTRRLVLTHLGEEMLKREGELEIEVLQEGKTLTI